MASQRDLAKQLLQRAGDDEAAAKAMLPIEAVTDAIVGMLARWPRMTRPWTESRRLSPGVDRRRVRLGGGTSGPDPPLTREPCGARFRSPQPARHSNSLSATPRG